MQDLKIVLVGPNKQQLNFVYDSLMFRVSSVVCYESGDTALLNLGEDCPDILMIDMDSPTVNALRICKVIKDNPRYTNLPIVLVSNGTSIKDTSLYLRGVDFVKKPFDATELFAKLNLHKTLSTICNKAVELTLKGA
jgi:DNA-binding response OmpR family regulator